MIDLSDVKREPHKTYYFFRHNHIDIIKHLLTTSNETDFQIFKFNQIKQQIPDNITIPNVPLRLTEGPQVPATAVLVSHFNPQDFHQKLMENETSSDWTEMILQLSKTYETQTKGHVQ